MIKKIFATAITLSSLLLANENNNNITVYNNDLRFFDETKNIEIIDKNNSSFIYSNVSPNLISDSVSISLPNNVKLLEQNYKYDLVNYNNILNYYIDKEITFLDYLSNNDFKKSKRILLSVENQNSVIKNLDNQNILTIPSKNIIVNKLPDGMITKPSLIFKTFSQEEFKNTDINLRYLSSGFNWKSDYVITLIGKELIANGWITLNNTTELSLKDYNLKFVSGNINNIDEINYNTRNRVSKSMMMNESLAGSSDMEVKEKSFNGYHIYNIPFKVDIEPRSKKQINFVNFKTTKWEKNNKIDLLDNINNEKYKFNQVISFDNKKENGLGMSLPNGNVRVYGKDLQDNSITFIGSNSIKDIPNNEKVELNIGENFDSVLETKLLDKNDNSYIIEYDLRNNSNEKQTYFIKQKIYNFNYKKIDEKMFYDSLCNKNNEQCEIKDVSHNIIEYKIILNGNENFNFKTMFSNTPLMKLK